MDLNTHLPQLQPTVLVLLLNLRRQRRLRQQVLQVRQQECLSHQELEKSQSRGQHLRQMDRRLLLIQSRLITILAQQSLAQPAQFPHHLQPVMFQQTSPQEPHTHLR
jgi:hypothetical protein